LNPPFFFSKENNPSFLKKEPKNFYPFWVAAIGPDRTLNSVTVHGIAGMGGWRG
jgi:hypothetical protein